MDEFKPAPVMIVQDLETLKILADPLRNQILEILAPEKLTINQMAEKLGLTPSKLYYHINLLEKHGLIQEVDTIVKANIIEKVYWISAYECKMDQNLFNFSTPEGQESVMTAMVTPINSTREDMLRIQVLFNRYKTEAVEEHPRKVVIYREVRKMSDETADRFAERFKEVLEDFENYAEDEKNDDAHMRALTVAFYPSFHYDPQED